MTISIRAGISKRQTFLYVGLVFFGAVIFSALFTWVNLANYRWLSPLFERQSTPAVWGILQRLYLILPAAAIALWHPRQIGFRVGKMRQYRVMLALMLLCNLAVIAGYLFLSGATPYSGPGMVFNEAVTVPLVEEIVWRGIVFAALVWALRKALPEETSGVLAGIISGICFGLLHASNALFGYPPAFVALQTLNATVWGVMYGIARAKTGSIYPSLGMHAIMNLMVALW